MKRGCVGGNPRPTHEENQRTQMTNHPKCDKQETTNAPWAETEREGTSEAWDTKGTCNMHTLRLRGIQRMRQFAGAHARVRTT